MSRPIFTSAAQRIMVALDVDELEEARRIAEALKDLGVVFKIGNQLGTYEGWKAAVAFSHDHGAQIFCDTKFKDIPITVEKSSRAITRYQPEFFNVMADNTLGALKGAVKGRDTSMEEFGLAKRPTLLGVTVLTSISTQECKEIYGSIPSKKVLQFAKNAVEAGLDGLVCSAQEAAMLRSDPVTMDLILVTPGIRPDWAALDDQSRVITPRQAIESGSDYVVIGRPITTPPKEVGTPRDAVLRIIKELEEIE